jgi:hypothetical protein
MVNQRLRSASGRIQRRLDQSTAERRRSSTEEAGAVAGFSTLRILMPWARRRIRPTNSGACPERDLYLEMRPTCRGVNDEERNSADSAFDFVTQLASSRACPQSRHRKPAVSRIGCSHSVNGRRGKDRVGEQAVAVHYRDLSRLGARIEPATYRAVASRPEGRLQKRTLAVELCSRTNVVLAEGAPETCFRIRQKSLESAVDLPKTPTFFRQARGEPCFDMLQRSSSLGPW